MTRRIPLFCVVLLAFLFVQPLTAQGTGEQIDTAAIAKIIDEGMNRSQIMETMSYLTDVYGPRLTGSPEYREAAAWAKKRLESYGVQNVAFDTWGPFGRGWTLKRFSAHATEPRSFPIIAYPKAWSPGVKKVSANVVYLDAKSESELSAYKGKLKGAIVLMSDPRQPEAYFKPLGERVSDAELLSMANAPPPQPRDTAALRQFRQFGERMRFANQRMEFAQKEGAVALFELAFKGDGGTIFVQGATVPQSPETPFDQRVSAYHPKAPKILPQIVLTPEHYNRLVRMIQKGSKVKVDLELDVQFADNQDGINIIGEIPGTDLKDEIVMIGAHFDSWHAGTGATDNGTGSAVCIEAMRILKQLNLPMRRTVRIGLWGGEEQGLIGSRMYVTKHFGEREGGRFNPTGPIKIKPSHEKFAAYFNNDNGTGKVRGVYLQGNDAVRPIFRAWLAPFEKMDAATLTLQNTGGTDHLSFDAVGLPGFQFIQDPIEYSPRTHHSNMDTYERVQEEDVKQAAIIMAAFAYNAAMRDEKIPRKPLPVPMNGQRQAGGN